MKAFIIGDINNPISTVAMRRLVNSIKATESKIDYQIFPATVPDTISEAEEKLFTYPEGNERLRWGWPEPSDGPRRSVITGLVCKPYAAKDQNKVKACFFSHVRLWKYAFTYNETIMVLEHDALFTNKFDWDNIKDKFTGGILGLNSPKGATRKADVFHNEIIKVAQTQKGRFVTDAPWVDKDRAIPQGLAGNSAYIIKPKAANVLLTAIMSKTGFWPNDAIMCKQLYPHLQVVYPYFTKVQGIQSTTTS